ncbi:hypothetical protein IQ273_11990 [Nodosilinea sp. LEGE 07298]|uniref:hypothetical protein n=1 Tax=Nodosilinea sp. LEGE 07298 TaxID=2777970 RepID=UPI001882705B|nr:hypothetical protein [Nodosilinea sp. LEGE 07298]MBE9110131.1 hypothetical protein [Nodosilinea sp. LEGE 07298]
MSRKLVSYRLADDLQQALKERASSEGISATELVNRLLRQGLAEDVTGDAMQQRVSQLEQVLHQLEQRVSDRSADSRAEGELAAPASDALGVRLLALEQKLDTLTTGVEEGCRSLKRLSLMVHSAAAHEPSAALGQSGPDLSTPEPNAYSPELSQDMVQMPLAALRKLLSSDPGD